MKAFLKKATPEISSEVDWSKADAFYSNGHWSAYYVSFPRVVHGLPCFTQHAAGVVDPVSGEIMAMQLEWNYDLEFPVIKNPITAEKAQEIWTNQTKMELSYHINTTVAESGEVSNRGMLIYSPESVVSPLDAATGKIVERTTEWEENDMTGLGELSKYSASESAPSLANSGKEILTKQEIEKTKEYAGLLSAEQARKIAEKYPELSLDKTCEFVRASLYQNYRDGLARKDEKTSYEWDLTYRTKVTEGDGYTPEISICLNAKTGELCNYCDERSSYSENEKKTVDEKKRGKLRITL